jgi:hypothetical protein
MVIAVVLEVVSAADDPGLDAVGRSVIAANGYNLRTDNMCPC